MTRLLTVIGNALHIDLSNIASIGSANDTMSDLLDSIYDTDDALDDATDSAKKLKNAVNGIDELNVNNPNSSSSSSGLSAEGLTALDDAFNKAFEEYQKVWDEAYENFENKIEGISDTIYASFQKAIDYIKNGEFSKLGEWIGSSVANGLNKFITPENFAKIGTTLAETLNTVVGAGKGFFEDFNWEEFGAALATSINQFFKDFNFEDLSEGLNAFKDGLKEALKGFLKTIKLQDIVNEIGGFLQDLDIGTIGLIVGIAIIKDIKKIEATAYVLSMLPFWIKKALFPTGSISFASLGIGISDIALKLGKITWLFPENLGKIWYDIEESLFKGTFLDTNTWDGKFKEIDKSIENIINNISTWFSERLPKASANTFDFVEIFETIFNWSATQDYWNNVILENIETVKTLFMEHNWVEFGAALLTTVFEGLIAVVMLVTEPIGDFLLKVSESVVEIFDKMFSDNGESKIGTGLGIAMASGIEEGYVTKIVDLTLSIKKWFDEDVSPWFSEEKWKEEGENIHKGLTFKWTEFSTWWSETGFKKWWDEKVTPFFTEKKWKEISDGMKVGVSEKWKSFREWWESTGFHNWWTKVEDKFKEDKWTFKGIKDGLTTAWTNAINGIKEIWNNFADWLNEKLKWEIDPIEVGGKTIFDGANINLGKIPKFATGGMPEDGLFMANHNELVGGFSNGRSAVANNDMIVEGIEGGVERAVERSLLPYLERLVSSNDVIASKDMSVELDSRELVSAINSRSSRNGFSFT